MNGLECRDGEGISTASRTRTLVGDVFSDDAIEVTPELCGGASCDPFIPAMSFLGDLRVGVDLPDSSWSRSGVLNRSLLGDAESVLGGRPRPRFTLLLPS